MMKKLSVRVRFSLYRNQGGFYVPEKNTATYLIETSKLPGSYYSLNRKGLLIDVFEDYYKPCHALSGIKTASALIYVMAGLFRNERRLDDCLLINDERLLAEAISSNLFLVMGKRIITPSLDQGCVEGVMRAVVLEIASAEGFMVEERPVDAEELPGADEVFSDECHKRY
jgi:branched-subunit amino acid aminotransferase/4-amino-4-deoxychorismate lyase